MKELMCNYVFKVLGSNNYQFRRKIPQDLIPHCGMKEIKKSLRTSDRREAERLSRIEASRLDSEWDSVRQSLIPADNLKPAEDKVISSVVQSGESTRAKYIGDDIWNREAKQVTAAVTSSLPARDGEDVESASYRRGYRCDDSSDTYPRFVWTVLWISQVAITQVIEFKRFFFAAKFSVAGRLRAI